jgi:hypothetical protein
MLSALKQGARACVRVHSCTYIRTQLPMQLSVRLPVASIGTGTTKYPTISDTGDIEDDAKTPPLQIPKEYFTIYDIEKTWNINQPEIHKMTLDFLEIVRIENLSVINAFYEVYIRNYKTFIRTHVLSSKRDGMIYDPGWGYCIFIENYSEQQMNYVFVQYIYGCCSDDSINYPNNIHLQYPMIKIRTEIIEWFRPRITGKVWSSIVKSLSQSEKYTKLYAIMSAHTPI